MKTKTELDPKFEYSDNKDLGLSMLILLLISTLGVGILVGVVCMVAAARMGWWDWL